MRQLPGLKCWTVSEFELKPRYYVHFQTHTLGKGVNPLIPLAMQFFYNDSFSIKYPIKQKKKKKIKVN